MRLAQILILAAIFNFFTPECRPADSERIPTFGEKIIGATFKSLAKTFTLVNDIDKIKEKNSAKIKNMDVNKFNKQRDKVYAVLKNLPPEFKSLYGVSGDMTKEQIVRNIESLDEQKINKIIDAVPDCFIADLFKQYMEKTKQKIIQSGIVMQIKDNWAKMIKGAHN